MGTERTLHDRKQDFVRGAIWDAAVDLFVDKGFEQTTVDDIARAAGVSKRSFFRYFSSKNDLMGQGMVSYGTLIADAIRTCPPSSSPLEVLRATVRHVAAGAAAYPRVRKIANVASTSVAAREAQLSRVAELEDRVAEAFRARSPARDELAPRLLAELTLSILDVTFREWLQHDQQDILQTTEHVFTVLHDLVCARTSRGGKRSTARVSRRARRRGHSPPSA
jgi:TetR/AcrR family transcriptional regulator, regulator of mycofactocin system